MIVEDKADLHTAEKENDWKNKIMFEPSGEKPNEFVQNGVKWQKTV